MGAKRASIALAAAAALAGCGEGEPKRAVDARTEVLRFYAVDAPAVALARSDPGAKLAQIDAAAAGLPAWERIRGAVLGPLHAAGLRRADLTRLTRPRDEIEGLDAAALAVGLPTPQDFTAGESLVVLATDRSAMLARLLRRSAQGGRLQSAGRLDEAVLYRSPDATFAVRDGVLVSAPTLATLRAAIERRDGDSDLQLDEDVVKSLFDELGVEGALLAYADLGVIRDADPGLRSLYSQAPWLAQLGQAAASVQPVAGSVRIDIAVKAVEGDIELAGLPVGATPTRFTISSSSAAELLPARRADPVRDLLLGLAPLAGEATATADAVRAQAAVAP